MNRLLALIFKNTNKQLIPKYYTLAHYPRSTLNPLNFAWRRYYTASVCRHCDTKIRHNTKTPLEEHQLHYRDAGTYGPKYDWRWKSNFLSVYYVCHNCGQNNDAVYTWDNDADRKIVSDYWKKHDQATWALIFK